MGPKEPPEKRYICSFPDCDARYNKQWKLDAHLCKHTGVKPFACEHGDCDKSFTSQYHLSRHELVHTGSRPFRCTEDGCSDTFTTHSNMLRHVARKHAADQRTYGCEVVGCERVFRKNKQLKLHMCEQHAELPPYRCSSEGCPMRFTCPSKQRRHEKVHSGYPCQEEACVFTGKTWTELLKHRKEAHRRTHPCAQCGKEFRDSWFLQQHMRVHANTRVVLKCPREDCLRSFTTEFNLRSHISSFHEGQRPFACTHDGCGKTFALQSSLTRHSVAHDPERRKVPKPRKPQPSRSLSSRLSGFNPSKSARQTKRAAKDGVSLPRRMPGQQETPQGQIRLFQDAALLGPAAAAAGLQVDGNTQHLFTQSTLELGH